MLPREPAGSERFATRIFFWAAVYGLVAAATLYFADAPHPHRLLYFGFAGIALVFQGVFLLIAREPRRFVPLMPLCVLEKLSFAVPALAFYARGRAEATMALGGAIDLVLAVLFFVSWRRMARSA